METRQKYDGMIVEAKEKDGILAVAVTLVDEPGVFAVLRVKRLSDVERLHRFLGKVMVAV